MEDNNNSVLDFTMSNSFLQRPVRLGGGNTKTHQIIQISIFKIEENWTKLLFKLRVSFYLLDLRNSEKDLTACDDLMF